MQTLTSKRILLGVTGGIAAYKSAELVRRLQDQGAQVRVVMTSSATEFITPMTMQALSRKSRSSRSAGYGNRVSHGTYRTGSLGRSGAGRTGNGGFHRQTCGGARR